MKPLVVVSGASHGIGRAVAAASVLMRIAGDNPDFISAEELADIIVFCWKQPQRICIRDIVVMPATSSFA